MSNLIFYFQNIIVVDAISIKNSLLKSNLRSRRRKSNVITSISPQKKHK